MFKRGSQARLLATFASFFALLALPVLAKDEPVRVANAEAARPGAAAKRAAAKPSPSQTASIDRPGASGSFDQFVAKLWPDAKAAGISRATFDRAFESVTPDPRIVALTKKQSEFVQPIWSYLASAAGGTRLSRGREVAERHAATLAAVERTYGVPRSVVLGVWGMETNYGSFTGNMDVVRSLATLAHLRYRGDFFRGELIPALTLLEQGLAREDIKGSWAGAMGHTQFMPTSYVKFRADGDGDGAADIWKSVPDALASTANYLKLHGWKSGLDWGYEVVLPDGFDFRNHRQSLASWAGLGLRRVDGGGLSGRDEAWLFLPAGASGPAFLVTENYDVIKSYNSSDAYALGVAHLGDRILGGPTVQGRWPVKEPQLGAKERIEIQKRLATLGHYEGETDGKFGSKTRAAVRAFQLDRGLPADGYADASLLASLRGKR